MHTVPGLQRAYTIIFRIAPTDWNGGEKHPAPRRAIFVTVRGEYEVTSTDGARRRFPAGSVLLIEDTTGDGHSTTITSDEDCIIFALGLADSNEASAATTTT